MAKEPLPRGFNCEHCKKHHEFSGYVFAYWSVPLDHKCDCGAKHTILKGRAKMDAAPAGRPPQPQ